AAAILRESTLFVGLEKRPRDGSATFGVEGGALGTDIVLSCFREERFVCRWPNVTVINEGEKEVFSNISLPQRPVAIERNDDFTFCEALAFLRKQPYEPFFDGGRGLDAHELPLLVFELWYPAISPPFVRSLSECPLPRASLTSLRLASAIYVRASLTSLW